MAFFDDPADQPQLGSVSIRMPNVGAFGPGGAKGLQFDRFLAYDYSEDFLTPADGWSFSVSGDSLSDEDRQAILPGARVEVAIDGQVQSIGYLDEIRTRTGEGGTVITLEGRDWLAPAVDSHIDPLTQFNPSMTLEDVLKATFEPFGMEVMAIDNIVNKNAITGRIYGTPTSKKKGKPLKSYILHELKPYQREGAFAFASRVSQRFGLWLWPAVDGKTIIVGQPDFDQPPRYTIQHRTDQSAANNNVIESDVCISRKDQPSILFCSGFGGGGEFAHSSLRCAIINPLIVLPLAEYDRLLAAYPGIPRTTPSIPALVSGVLTVPIPDPNARPLYLYDGESHTLEQLEAYARRELALFMRKSLCAKYTVEGHKLNGQPIAVDTMVTVDDDRSDLHADLWIMSRRFSKRPDSGTRTTIEAIRPGTLQF